MAYTHTETERERERDGGENVALEQSALWSLKKMMTLEYDIVQSAHLK